MTKKPANDTKSSSETSAQRSGQDVVLIHGLSEDKKGLRVLRARNDQVEAGEVRPLVEGQPITSDVVRLKPRAGMPLLCDVETEVTFEGSKPALSKGSAASAARSGSAGRSGPLVRSGPAQVASRAYRDNWDTIWSRSAASALGDPSKLN